jgi:hypothetical protein
VVVDHTYLLVADHTYAEQVATWGHIAELEVDHNIKIGANRIVELVVPDYIAKLEAVDVAKLEAEHTATINEAFRQLVYFAFN